MENITLQDIILAHVNDNSGGIKFTELLTKLVQILILNDEKIPEDFPDTLENIIRNSKDMKILDYTWKICDQSKMFVYTE